MLWPLSRTRVSVRSHDELKIKLVGVEAWGLISLYATPMPCSSNKRESVFLVAIGKELKLD
jgi:hypothetical protein